MFTAALSRTKDKAPIYVSFGDAASGPNTMREMFERLTKTVTNAVIAEIASNAKDIVGMPDVLKDDAAASILEQTLQNSYRSAVNQEIVQRELNALTETIE